MMLATAQRLPLLLLLTGLLRSPSPAPLLNAAKGLPPGLPPGLKDKIAASSVMNKMLLDKL
jgi:hypothetical protein